MIAFVGLAGAGKSTMGQLLAAHLHCPWISTGNLLRMYADPDTQKQMLRGEMIDDSVTLKILEAEFHRIGANQNQFILDGSPRNMRQAKWLVEKVHEGELKITCVIHLESSKQVAHDRLMARRRPDDTEDAIKERFREYEDNVKPMIKYLEQEGFRVHHINSERNPEEIETDLERILGL